MTSRQLTILRRGIAPGAALLLVAVLARGGEPGLRDVPIAVQTVTSVDILQDQPDIGGVLNRISSLKPGVVPGGPTLRGVTGQSAPLTLIDGLPVNAGTAVPALNPQDIESIQVLKGAAGTLYGSDAIGGVVLITTRSLAGKKYDLPTDTGSSLYGDFIGKFNGALDCYPGSGCLPGNSGSVWQYNPTIGPPKYTIRLGDTYAYPWQTPPTITPGTTQTVNPPPPPAPASSSTSTSSTTTSTPTELQSWTRGNPPWSMVERSPECAQYLDELKPLYQQRDQARADMVYFGDYTLSDWQLRENEPELRKAEQSLQSSNEAIAAILKRCVDPQPAPATAVASVQPTVQLDMSWVKGATRGGLLLDPLTTALIEEDLYQKYLDDLYKEWLDDPAADYDEWCEDCGEWEEWSDEEDKWVPSRYQDLYDAWDAGVKPRSLLYLTSRLRNPLTQDLTLQPAKGAGYNLLYPYESKMSLPLKGRYKDPLLNSSLGSYRGFADDTGLWQPRRYVSDSFSLDRLFERSALGKAGIDWNWKPDQTSQPGIGGKKWNMPFQFEGSDDFWLRGRIRTGEKYFDAEGNSWNLPAPPTSTSKPVIDFDPTSYRLGYNLKEGWAAFTVDATPVEAANVAIDQYRGPPVHTLQDVPSQYLERVSEEWKPYISGGWSINDRLYLNFNWFAHDKPAGDVSTAVRGAVFTEKDECAREALPLKSAAASAGPRRHDQWAQRAIGFAPGANDAGKLIKPGARPIVVAVIDTGLDWHHHDFSWDNLWINSREIPDNGVDDDGNGYVDDVFGWDFIGNTNRPWDHDGHGTFVTGLIAATRDNRAGIDGINPNARIMVLKALGSFGGTRASGLAQAVKYAVDNGAKIINLSVAGPGAPRVVQDALDYADAKGVLVIAAAGNDGGDISKVQPAGLRHVITVAATDPDGRRAAFSNWGASVAIAAPGMQVMSLRARQTDFRLNSAATEYEPGSGFVGIDRLYYRADGTSFAAPMVTGVASLIWSGNPGLTSVQVRRMLEQSARDIDAPGRDQFTGYGMLDAVAALSADPEFFMLATVDSVRIATVRGNQVVEVVGVADADRFREATLEIGAGENPAEWKRIDAVKETDQPGVLGAIPIGSFAGSAKWTIRVVVTHRDGRKREARYLLTVG